jgi:O-antigen ligase
MVFGTGLGDKMDVLKNEYAKKGFVFGIQTNRNTHNNYLDIWLSLGLTGLIIFLTGFIIWPLFTCFRTNDWFGAIIIISFTLSLLSETYMDRTMGNTLLAFFTAFISSYKKPVKITAY